MNQDQSEGEVLEGVGGDAGDTGDVTQVTETAATGTATSAADHGSSSVRDVSQTPVAELTADECAAEIQRLEDPYTEVRALDAALNLLTLELEKKTREINAKRTAIKLDKMKALQASNTAAERKRQAAIRLEQIKSELAKSPAVP